MLSHTRTSAILLSAEYTEDLVLRPSCHELHQRVMAGRKAIMNARAMTRSQSLLMSALSSPGTGCDRDRRRHDRQHMQDFRVEEAFAEDALSDHSRCAEDDCVHEVTCYRISVASQSPLMYKKDRPGARLFLPHPECDQKARSRSLFLWAPIPMSPNGKDSSWPGIQ